MSEERTIYAACRITPDKFKIICVAETEEAAEKLMHVARKGAEVREAKAAGYRLPSFYYEAGGGPLDADATYEVRPVYYYPGHYLPEDERPTWDSLID